MNHFVPADEIAKLVEGSFEHLASRLEDLVREESVKLFGSEIPTKVLATFPEHVIVAAGDGRFAKVKYARTEAGDLKVVANEDVTVPVYTPKTIDTYVAGQAEAIIDRFFAGQLEDAQDRVLALAPFVTESIVAEPPAVRPWKRIYEERAAVIKQHVGADLQKLDEAKLAPKFNRLTDGTIPADQHEGYRDLVVADLTYLSERVSALTGLVEHAVTSVKKVHVEDDDADEVVAMFGTFAEDLCSDLKALVGSISESLNSTSEVLALAKLYDGLVEGLYHHEVAGRFVERLAAKLCEATE